MVSLRMSSARKFALGACGSMSDTLGFEVRHWASYSPSPGRRLLIVRIRTPCSLLRQDYMCHVWTRYEAL